MELPILNTFSNFSCHHCCCFTVAALFDLDKSTAWNRCLQHLCFENCVKLLKPLNFKFQRPTLPFGFANTYMNSLHALCTPKLPIPLSCHEEVSLPYRQFL
jgi:hypothetical protein